MLIHALNIWYFYDNVKVLNMVSLFIIFNSLLFFVVGVGPLSLIKARVPSCLLISSDVVCC